MFSLKKSILSVAASVLATSVVAAPVVYFGETINPGSTVQGFAADARAQFVSQLDGTVQSYGFETASLGANANAVGPISFSGGSSSAMTATIAGDGSVTNAANSGGGRFNTTPGFSASTGKFWQARAGGTGSGNVAGSFSIAFDQGISGFGFYGTDIGDFEGILSLILTPVGGGADVTLTMNNVTGTNANGSLLFFGFTDLTTAYSRITFSTSGVSATTDYFGFDDFLVANRSQIVTGTAPEPGSLALVGLSLLAAGAVLRKRKAA